MNHPEKSRMVAAAISEIDGLINIHGVLRVVTIDRYRQVLHDRGPGMVKLLNSLLIFTTKKTDVGGNIHTAGTTCLSRIKGRLTACERKSEHHYDTDVSSPSSDLAAARMFFCIVLVMKLEIKCCDGSKACCQGILPVGDNQPSYFLRFPSLYSALGRPTSDERGRSLLFEITGNLYGLIRAGETWLEYMKKWLTNELLFEQSVVNPCIFHKHWNTDYYCPIMNATYPGGQKCHVVLYVDNTKPAFSIFKDPDGRLFIRNWYTSKFHKQFGSSDAGADSELTFFIGLRFHHDDNAISVRCPATRRRLSEAMAQYNIPILSDANIPLPERAIDIAYEPADNNSRKSSQHAN